MQIIDYNMMMSIEVSTQDMMMEMERETLDMIGMKYKEKGPKKRLRIVWGGTNGKSDSVQKDRRMRVDP